MHVPTAYICTVGATKTTLRNFFEAACLTHRHPDQGDQIGRLFSLGSFTEVAQNFMVLFQWK
jgi:hypothetical protein